MRTGNRRASGSKGWLPAAVGVVIALALTLELGFALQDEEAPPPPPAPDSVAVPDSVPLVFEREVFSYPSYERRNPFRPLTGEDVGPRFEDLQLMGVLVSMDRSRSVATIAERVGGANQTPTQIHRLREGDVIGNTRIFEIRDRWVTVQVEEFGQYELRTLEVRRAAPTPVRGATPPAADPLVAPPPADPLADPAEGAGDGAAGALPTPTQGARSDSPNGNGGRS